MQKTIFRGSELVTTGKLRDGKTNIRDLIIKALARNGTISINGTAGTVVTHSSKNSDGALYSNFLERLWAYQSVRRYLERLEAGFDADNKTEINKKALDICLKVRTISFFDSTNLFETTVGIVL